MKLKLELTNNLMCISPALSFVEALCRERGLSERENKQFQLALEEVLSNVVEFAFDHEEEHSFDVFVTDTPSYIEIKVCELGIPYIFDQARQFDPTRIHCLEDAVNQKGLGSYIVSRMVDSLEYKYLGAAGKETTLVKHICNPQVTEYRPKAKPATLYTDKGITIHLFREEEALSVARCLYTAYGYTYLKFSLYEPGYLREISGRHDTIIATAVSSDGEVAGVVIGKEEQQTKGIMEMGSLVVSPLYRGLHIAEKIAFYMLDEIARSGRNGVFAECVSLHPASQRASLKMGLKPCLVFVNYIPNSVNFKKFDNLASQRQTFVVYYKRLNDRKSRIYIPERHADKIKRIYERIDVPYELLTAVGDMAAVSELSVQRNDTFGVSAVLVGKVGTDIGFFLKNILRLAEFVKTKTWCLYLYMNDPNLEYGVDEAEKAGFMFTGVLPGSDNGDLLIMQHTTDVEWLRKDVLIAEREDEWMLDFIEERYDEINKER